LSGAIAEIDGGTDGAQIVRARTGWDDDQFGDGDNALDRHRDRRGSVDYRKADTLLAKDLEVGCETGDDGLGKSRHVGLAPIPPNGEAALRIDVDQADRTSSCKLSLHRKMSGQGRLTRPPLLRCQCQDAHAFPLG